MTPSTLVQCFSRAVRFQVKFNPAPSRAFSSNVSRTWKGGPETNICWHRSMARTSKVALLFLVPTGSALILGLSLKTNSAYCEAGGKSDQVGSGLPPNLVIAEEQNLDHAEQELKAALKPRDIPSRTIISLIWKHLRPDWLLLFAIIAVTSASAFVNVMTPMVVGELVSLIQSMLKNPLFGTIDFDIKVLNRPATKLLILFMSQGFLTFVDITLVTRLGENLAQRLRHDLAGSILKQDIAFFDAHMQGEVVGRLTQDVSEFKHTFKLCVTQGLKCTAQIVGSAYHLFRISPSLTLTLLSTMPVVYVGMNLYGAFLRQLSKDARLFDGFAAGVVSEAVSNIRTVRAFASEDRELERYEEATREASVKSLALGFHIGAFQGITNSTVGLMILIILYSGGNLVVKGELTGGQLMSYMVATQTAQRSLALVGALVGQVVKALSSAQRVVEYMNVRPTIHLNDGIIPAKFDGTIEFVDIGFTYPTRPNAPVLQNFSLIIPRGKVVALCGMSGSGKSTVGQLIERFYDPDFGKVLIDGIDVRQLNGNWLHDNIGYINQEPILFATSILENIRYGRPDASMDEVIRAAKEANAASFIESFPNKYDTVVGERGVTLSGGQKQRIAIARALLKDPKVLILDEATSALDTESERVVQEALDRLMKGRTTLVIAHRLSTIQAADMIVVMSGHGKESRLSGNILEKGTHVELMRARAAYFRLYNQLKSEERHA